jgi:ABC-type multidrug transport system fused ATPase/permease subunit
VSFAYRVSDEPGKPDKPGNSPDSNGPNGLNGLNGHLPSPLVPGVSALNLDIQAGECVVLCGRSGCGKTTVTRLINGLAPQFYPGELSGTITIDGINAMKMPLAHRARLVGSVFQNPRSQFFNMDTTSELAFGCENLEFERNLIVQRVEAAVGAFSLEKLLGRSIFEFSGGEKQRIACGSVHATRPRIYLLDEPSSNLDLASVAQLRDALALMKRQGATIILAEHRLYYLDGLADRYLHFKNGRLHAVFTPAHIRILSKDERARKGLRCLSLEEAMGESRPTVSVSSVSAEPALSDPSVSAVSFPLTFPSQTLSPPPPLPLANMASDDDGTRPLHSSGALRVEGLRCFYNGRQALSIDHLALQHGEVVALIGANGAGKSTLARCLCGIKAHKGRVFLNGKLLSARQRIASSYLVMQDVNHQLFTESVREELLLSARSPTGATQGSESQTDAWTEDRIDKLLTRLDLAACADKHPVALSGGQKQRVAVASALVAHKRLLFFDEPTSGLDHTGMRILCALIGELERDVLLTVIISHDLELILGCCTSVLRLENGEVAEYYPLDESGRKQLLDWGNTMMKDRIDGQAPLVSRHLQVGTKTPSKTPRRKSQKRQGSSRKDTEAAQQSSGGFGRLLQFALMRKGYALASVILAALAAVCGFIPAVAIYLLVAQLAALYPHFSTADPAALMAYGWLALAGLAGNIILYFAALCFSHIAAFGTIYQLKIDFASHLGKVPLGFFIQMGSGRLRKVMDDNIEKIEGFIAHQLPDIVAGVTAPVVMFVILLGIDWRFGLVSLLGIAIAFALEVKAYGGATSQLMAQKYQRSLEDMSNATVEYVRGISVVKAFRQTAYSFTRLRETIREYTSFVIPYTLNWENPMSAFMAIVNNIYIFVIPLGIFLGAGATDLPTFASRFLFYLIFVPCIASVMTKLMYVSTNAMQISSGVEAMDRILSSPVLPEPHRPAALPTTHDIVFEDVRFSYAPASSKPGTGAPDMPETTGAPASSKPSIAKTVASSASNEQEGDRENNRKNDGVGGDGNGDGAGNSTGGSTGDGTILPFIEALKGVSFTARQGEVTALVGPSGSGKTTIAHLICRFFDVDGGRILLGEKDIRSLKTEQLMDQVSFVFQDVFLFRQSVRDNIRMARLGASDEEVIEAARAAQCHEFIGRLPQGYDTVIGAGGVHLSGGERQRVALARAIIKDAPVVVLDEATAFADPENEYLIQRAFERLMRGKTVVMIAHRLGTVTGADQILVVEGGRIVEQGRHTQLLNNNGRYAGMWDVYERAASWSMGRAAEEREHDHV